MQYVASIKGWSKIDFIIKWGTSCIYKFLFKTFKSCCIKYVVSSFESTNLLASPVNTLTNLVIWLVSLNVVFKQTMILKFPKILGQQLQCLLNVNTSIVGKFCVSRCWCTALITEILSLELVSNVIYCTSSNRSTNKWTGSIYNNEIDRSKDLWLISKIFGCF